MLLSSLKMFKQNIFTGVGPKMYRYECKNEEYFIQLSNETDFQGYCSTHPHNIYAQLFAETGILGGLTISFFFFNFTISNHKRACDLQGRWQKLV